MIVVDRSVKFKKLSLAREFWVIIWYISLLEILLLGNTVLQCKCIETCKIREKNYSQSYLKFHWNWASNPTCREILFTGSFPNIIHSIIEMPSKVLIFISLYATCNKNSQLKEFLMRIWDISQIKFPCNCFPANVICVHVTWRVETKCCWAFSWCSGCSFRWVTWCQISIGSYGNKGSKRRRLLLSFFSFFLAFVQTVSRKFFFLWFVSSEKLGLRIHWRGLSWRI